MGRKGTHFTLPQLGELGVRRVSLGSSLSRAALGGFIRAAREIARDGSFGFIDEAPDFAEVSAYMAPRAD
jgi:2-methylisocitrate lyase-like PEP mutase family enzyme